MTLHRVRVWFCALAIGVIATSAAVNAADGDVRVRASLDRTAMWVADRVTFAIELTCANGVDIVADDLSRDKLKLEGLEVVGGETDRRSGPGDTTIYRVRFVLTTYRVDAPALRIGPLTVRYAVKREGQRLEEAPPAGEVQVPGATIALRSVLPEDKELAAIRSDRPPDVRPLRFAVLQPIGIALIIVSAIPALMAIVGLVRAGRRPRVRRSARAVRHEERASLDAIRALNVDTIEGRREVFTHIERMVRDHLREVCGVAGASLTPQEVPVALATAGGKVPAELAASVLATCELARYAPAQAIPSAEACQEAIEQVEEIIAGRGARGF